MIRLCIKIALLTTGFIPALLLAQGTKEDHERAKRLQELAKTAVIGDRPSFDWSADGDRIIWRVETGVEQWRFRTFDSATNQVRDLFDHGAVAEALAKTAGGQMEHNRLPLSSLDLTQDGIVHFKARGKYWDYDPQTRILTLTQEREKQIELVAFSELSRRNQRSGEETIFICRNETKEPIQIQWIGFDGDAHTYGKIEAGASQEFSSYVGHRWRAVNAAGEPLAAWSMPKSGNSVVIRGEIEGKPRENPGLSPDGKWIAYVQNRNLMIRSAGSNAETTTLGEAVSNSSYEGSFLWSPDSSRLIALHSKSVEQRMLTLVESSPADQIQPKVTKIPYTKPGDAISQPMPRLFDVTAKREIVLDSSLYANPWSIEELAWSTDSKECSFVYNQRGHQVMRILGINAVDGKVRKIHEETSKTFIDYSQKYYFKRFPAKREILWMSEQDGWNHLYLLDEISGKVKTQITRGTWNVREVVSVDEEKRTILFRAYGLIQGQDPYFSQFARINFDGSGMTMLTEANGTHTMEISPNGKYLLAQWSRVDQPPVAELRDATSGKKIAELNRADDSAMRQTGWTAPEAIAAKGRDGKTDIYGVLIKPSNFDPAKRYPVIENIYSGPHDFFTPKRYAPWQQMNQLAELGFIVVMIDGMSTNWRGRTFHDVAWKNLSDAGLPDHMAWLKSAAQTRPWMDLSRVGIYGGSAGGQNALSALLHHGDFYKAAVADCGCHDNRMDKIWWNEAWMGWPVDESYERNSNVVHAAKLQGKLMLVVGEIDSNVDPSSTLQVANALEKADKDFDLVIMTSTNHGAAESAYASRRRADFFLRNLWGVEPRSK